MYYTNLIYYDENIDYDSENYGYVKAFKNKIQGAFFPVKDINTLKNVVNRLNKMNINNSFTLVTSGRAAEKVIPICSSVINRIIIFCFYVDKYLPLKSKYGKIKAVINNFDNIFDNLISNSSLMNSKLIQSKFITFNDYKDNYISLHKKLAYFFVTSYNKVYYDSNYRNIFIEYINNSDIDLKSEAIKLLNDVVSGTVGEFIAAYTGENILCYRLNRWMRNCDSNQYEKVKYFSGPFSYALYHYAYKDRKQGVYASKNFYRKMTIKLSDFLLYKIFVGELICYPAFTSTSEEEDMKKYDFPTGTAISVNEITPNDVSVALNIKYTCKNCFNVTPCINAVNYSVNAGEREFIFPPFSFFKIEKVVEKEGIPSDPHVIYMSVPNKKNLIEFGLKNNKTICYNKETNELYY